eukprot:TRINITY_DN1269_c0_g1_i1.p1 TRINITY_DN1269_c0_g1~~TRINITY_DN1269_c0_g1_i1.p1  ORF type:complete len:387 (-),score=78.91 TRINITY_DN1269_c0_g1_i1:81-1079(-)
MNSLINSGDNNLLATEKYLVSQLPEHSRIVYEVLRESLPHQMTFSDAQEYTLKKSEIFQMITLAVNSAMKSFLQSVKSEGSSSTRDVPNCTKEEDWPDQALGRGLEAQFKESGIWDQYKLSTASAGRFLSHVIMCSGIDWWQKGCTLEAIYKNPEADKIFLSIVSLLRIAYKERFYRGELSHGTLVYPEWGNNLQHTEAAIGNYMSSSRSKVTKGTASVVKINAFANGKNWTYGLIQTGKHSTIPSTAAQILPALPPSSTITQNLPPSLASTQQVGSPIMSDKPMTIQEPLQIPSPPNTRKTYLPTESVQPPKRSKHSFLNMEKGNDSVFNS